MATTVTDCQSMIEVTRANGVKLMVAYRLHFEPANLRAIERVRNGEIGAPPPVGRVKAVHAPSSSK